MKEFKDSMKGINNLSKTLVEIQRKKILKNFIEIYDKLHEKKDLLLLKRDEIGVDF